MWKTIEFYLLAATAIPVGILICQFYQRFMYFIFACMLFSTLFYEKFTITFLSREWYKTATWGFDITAFDIGCIILFFGMLLRPDTYKIRWLIPLTIPFILYMLAQVIAWFHVDTWVLNNPLKKEDLDFFEEETIRSQNFEIGLFPLFEMFKFLRFYFILWVMTNFMINQQSVKTLTLMFAVLILSTTFTGLFQRYVQGVHQVTGGLGQIHLLNVYSGMMGCYLFALSFAEKKIFKKYLFLFFFACTVLAVILTIGRIALTGLVISSCIVIVLSLIRFPNAPNFGMIILLGLAGFVFLVKAYDSLVERFNLQLVSSTLEGRIDLNATAVQMAQHHPFGIGGGNFAAFYASSYLADPTDPIALAHNIYYLNLAEFGYLGLFAFLLFQLRVIQILLSNFYSRWNDEKVIPYLIGILGALIVLQMQDFFHFSSRHNTLAAIYLTLFAISTNIYLERLKFDTSK